MSLSNVYVPKIYKSTPVTTSKTITTSTTTTTTTTIESSSITCNVNVISDASGSCYIQMGSTIVICSVHGPQSRTFSSHVNVNDSTGIFECECHYAPFAYNDDIDKRNINALERNMASIIKDSIEISIKLEKYPKTSILLYIVILQSGGLENDTSVAINAGSLALADASIELSDLVTSCVLDINHQNNNDKDKGKCIISFMLTLEEITQLWFQGKLNINDINYMTNDAKQKCLIIRKIMKETLIQKVLKLK